MNHSNRNVIRSSRFSESPWAWTRWRLSNILFASKLASPHLGLRVVDRPRLSAKPFRAAKLRDSAQADGRLRWHPAEVSLSGSACSRRFHLASPKAHLRVDRRLFAQQPPAEACACETGSAGSRGACYARLLRRAPVDRRSLPSWISRSLPTCEAARVDPGAGEMGDR